VIDPILCCFYCGEILPNLTEKQIKTFGKPECCGEFMMPIDRNKIHCILKAFNKIKINLEKELVSGFGCEQYVEKLNE